MDGMSHCLLHWSLDRRTEEGCLAHIPKPTWSIVLCRILYIPPLRARKRGRERMLRFDLDVEDSRKIIYRNEARL